MTNLDNNSHVEALSSRPLKNEELVRIQLERIMTIRSDVANPHRVSMWSEAVEALADTLVPWWDSQFRKEWSARKVAGIDLGNGELLPMPTADDVRRAQLVLMRLLDRSNLLVRRRTVSGPSVKVFGGEELGIEGQERPEA